MKKIGWSKLNFTYFVSSALISLVLIVLASCSVPSNYANGQILFVSERDLRYPTAYLLDLGSGQTSLLLANFVPHYEPSWSSAGEKIIYATSSFQNNTVINILYSFRIGASRPHPILDGGLYPLSDPAWSPDGTSIVYTSTSGQPPNAEIFKMDADGSNKINLTKNPGIDKFPVWSPDGTKIAFMSDRNGNHEIFVMDANGDNPVNITRHPAQDIQPSWSPDGTKILFTSNRDDPLATAPTATFSFLGSPPKKINLEIYMMNANGSGQVNISNHPSSDSQPA